MTESLFFLVMGWGVLIYAIRSAVGLRKAIKGLEDENRKWNPVGNKKESV